MVLPIDAGNMALLKLNPALSAKDALSKIEPVFKKFNPEQPFEYNFVDDDYAQEIRQRSKG